MAEHRDSPYIWATWLAKLMAGDATCQWQYWFQTHNRLTEKRPDAFDLVGWQVDHSRMVDELRRDLTARGFRAIVPHKFRIPTPRAGGVISGEIDCLVVNQDEFQVYDCKTGMSRTSDTVQVMIYMYALSQQSTFSRKRSNGIVVYKDRRVEIPNLPATFASNLEYFADLLIDETPAPKNPGDACEHCHITENDCADRLPP